MHVCLISETTFPTIYKRIARRLARRNREITHTGRRLLELDWRFLEVVAILLRAIENFGPFPAYRTTTASKFL